MGCPNPYELQQSWECTILKVLSFTKIIWSSKKIFTYWIQNYQLSSMANSAFMGHIGHVALASNSETGKRNFFLRSFCLSMIKDFQKSTLPCLLQFVRVRAAHQPHVVSEHQIDSPKNHHFSRAAGTWGGFTKSRKLLGGSVITHG